MVIEQLQNKIVFLDTAPLIYFIEGHSVFQQQLRKLFLLNDQNYFKFLTSTITLLEILVKPLRAGDLKVVENYKTILTNSTGITIFEINNSIAFKAAEIRAKYNIHTPDALQIATSIEWKADYFLTNDFRLKAIKELKIIMPQELELI